MNWFLPRGYCFSEKNRIKKLVAEGSNWQIFLTNLDSHALVVTPEMYDCWVNEYSLPQGLFLQTEDQNYYYLVSSSDYIISSLAQGPFPENNGQVQAFSMAFKTALDITPNMDLHDAVYIEEYSMILPVVFDDAYSDNGIPYGKWLTGGINISIESIGRVSKIMSWLPSKAIVHAANTAGFVNVEEPEVESQAQVEEFEQSDHTDEPVLSKEHFTLIGRPELETFFNENIVDIVLHQEEYKRMGIAFPGATILYGPPGCGKTYAVERLAKYLGWKRFDIDSSTIASSYIHDTSKKISEVFREAIKAAPSILVIDEMEAFLSDRGMAGPSGTHHVEEVAEFLRRIPEVISKGVLVFAMTNMIDSIDPAILRRGRFDHIIEVRMANAEEISALLKERFKELPVDETVNIEYIAQELSGHPMSDVSFVIRESGRIAVKRKLAFINADCFSDALNLLPKKKEKAKIGFIT